MHYECKLDEGKHLEISNDGDQTIVSFSSRDPGQHQSQGNAFTTGKWVKPPAIFRMGEDLVVWAEITDGGRTFLRVRGRQIEMLDREPDLTGAVEVTLTKSSDEGGGMKPMKPMRPMEPMQPMKPMSPMD